MAYTDEVNAQIIIALLKRHCIRRIVASPGTTNMALVASVQNDPFFQLFSSVDERSAAYLACGLASETGEPVVISCTGATASRNYMPGLTEAYYRKLPILAITSTQGTSRVGHHVAQVIDRSVIPNDIAKLSLALPIVNTEDELWECEIKVNRAVLELKRHGGGPVHINLPTTYSQSFDVKELPRFRVIDRITAGGIFPELPTGKVAIFVGAHATMSKELTSAIDAFCASHDAVVFCDHTSGYYGINRVQYCLAGLQQDIDMTECQPALLIHIGEVSGDYYSAGLAGNKVWRVSEDGEIRDTFRKLECVYEMPEQFFFQHYSRVDAVGSGEYLSICKRRLTQLHDKIPELPFSNIWIASEIAHRVPPASVIHFGILNSLRSWNFFELPPSVRSASNVGGFGIDGCLSTLVGASLANPDRLCFGVIGDLAFFYDMNVMGNRHVGSNLRIMVVNNGKGVEFRNFNHPAAHFGAQADAFIAAAGHFGRKSAELIKHYVEDLGLQYLSARSKAELEQVSRRFLAPDAMNSSVILEVFTDGADESNALELMANIEQKTKGRAKQFAESILGEGGVSKLKRLIGR